MTDNSSQPGEQDVKAARNSIEPGREVEAKRDFDLPEAILRRYDVRVIEGAAKEERKIGLFLPGEKTPALEVGERRIATDRQDLQTVNDLVAIAKHNGWDNIQVAGTEEFRRLVWQVASREGLRVSGYEPTKEDDRSRVASEQVRKQSAAERSENPAGATAGAPAKPEKATAAPRPDFNAGVTGRLVEQGEAPPRDNPQGKPSPYAELELADGRRERAYGVALPEALAGHALGDTITLKREGRQPVEVSVDVVDPSTGETSSEKRTVNRNVWSAELVERAPEASTNSMADLSAMLANAGKAAGAAYIDMLHERATAGATRDPSGAVNPALQVAQQVRQLRGGEELGREDIERIARRVDGVGSMGEDRQSELRGIVMDEAQRGSAEAGRVSDANAGERATIGQLFEKSIEALEAIHDPQTALLKEAATSLFERSEGEGEPSGRDRGESEALADLFLSGPPEAVAREPRLATALEAQATMERHIAELMGGDRVWAEAANLESRQMISDALRRGLNVSVRESTPVREVTPPAPVQAAGLER